MNGFTPKTRLGFVVIFFATFIQLTFAQDITVTIPDTSFENGSVLNVEIPISTSNISIANNILSYDLTIEYNSTIISFDTISTIGTISTSAINVSTTAPIPTGLNSEQVSINATFASALVGSGTLIKTSFDLVGNTGNTLLDLESIFNSGLVNSISIDGNLEIFNKPILSLPISDFALIEDASDSLLFDIDNHFSDLDSDVLNFQIQNSNSNLVQHSINTNNEFIVSLTSDSSGIAIFIITATDADGSVSDTFSVNVSPENDAPFVTNTISNQTFQEDSGTNLIVNDLNTVFTDIDSPNLTFTTSVNGSGITSNVNSNSLSISTVQDSFGVYLVSVLANDGQDSVSTSFSITINSENDNPFVANSYGSITILEEDSVTLGSLSNVFADVEDQNLNYSFLNKNPASIQVTLIGDQPKIKPIPNFFNTNPDTIIFIAQDSEGLTANDTLFVNVTNINDLPIRIGFMEDVTVNEDILPFALEDLNSIFSDVDNNLNFSVIINEPEINVNISNGIPIVTLASNYFNTEPDTLVFIGTDPFGEFVTDTISLTVLPLNDPPLITNPFSTITVLEDINTDPQLTFDLNDFFQSPDGDTLNFSLFENSNHFSVSLQGILQNIASITLVADSFNTVDSFNPNPEFIIFSATDDDFQTVSDTLPLVIEAVNDPPRANYQSIQVIGNTQTVTNTPPFVVAPLNDQFVGFRDPEGDAIDVNSYTVSSSAPNIAFVEIVNDTSQTGQVNYIPRITVNSTPPIQYGNVTFTFTAAELATGFAGSDSFVLTVYDPDPVVVGPVISLFDAQLIDGTTGVFYASQGTFNATVTETGIIDVFQNSVIINYYSPITSTVPFQTVFPSYTSVNGNGQNEIIAITDTFNITDPTITEFKTEIIAFNVVGDTSSNSRNYIIDRNIPNLNAIVTPTQIPFSVGLNASVNVSTTFNDSTITGIGAGIDTTFARVNLLSPSGSNIIFTPTVNGSPNSTCTFNTSILGFSEVGTYTLILSVRDRVGNVKSITKQVTVNSTQAFIGTIGQENFNYFNPEEANPIDFTVRQLTSLPISLMPLEIDQFSVSNLLTNTLTKSATLSSSIISGDSTYYNFTANFPSGTFDSTATFLDAKVTVVNLQDSLLTTSNRNFILDSKSPTLTSVTTDLGSPVSITKGQSISLIINFSDPAIGGFQGSLPVTNTALAQVIRPDGSIISPNFNFASNSSGQAQFNQTQLPGSYNLRVVMEDNVGNVLDSTHVDLFSVNGTAPTVLIPTIADFNNFLNPNPPNEFSFTVTDIDTGTTPILVNARVLNAENLNILSLMNAVTLNSISDSTITFNSGGITSGIDSVKFEVTVTNDLGLSNLVSQNYLIDSQSPSILSFSSDTTIIKLGEQLLFSGNLSEAVLGSGIDETMIEIEILAPDGTTSNHFPPTTGNDFNRTFNNFPFNGANLAGNYVATLSVSDNVGNSNQTNTNFFVNDDSLQIQFLPSDFGFFFNPTGIDSFSLNAIKLGTSSISSISGTVYNADNSIQNFGSNSESFSSNSNNSIPFALATNIPLGISNVVFEATVTNLLGNSITRTQVYSSDQEIPTLVSFDVQPNPIFVNQSVQISASMLDSISGLDTTSFELQIIAPAPSSSVSNLNLVPQSILTSSNSVSTSFATNNVAGTYNVHFSFKDNVGNLQTFSTTYEVNDTPAPLVSLNASNYLNFLNPMPPNPLSITISEQAGISLPNSNGISYTVLGQPSGTVILNSILPNYVVADTIHQILEELNLTTLPQTDTGIDVSVTATNVLGYSNTKAESYIIDSQNPSILNFLATPDSIEIDSSTIISASFVEVGSGIDSVFVRSQKNGSTNDSLLFSGTESQFNASVISFGANIPGTYTLSLDLRDNVGNESGTTTTLEVNAKPHQISFLEKDFQNYFLPTQSDSFSFVISKPLNQTVNLKSKTNGGILISVFDAQSNSLIENIPTNSFSNFDPLASSIPISFGLSSPLNSSVSLIRVEVTVTNILNDVASETQNYRPDFFAPTFTNFSPANSSIAIGDTIDIILNNLTDPSSNGVLGSGVDSVEIISKKVGTQTTSLLFSGTNAQFVNSTTIFTTQFAGTYVLFLRITDNVGNETKDTTQFVVNANPPQINFASSEFGDYFKPQSSNSFSLTVSEIDNIAFQKLTISVFDNANGSAIQNPIVFTPPDTSSIYNFSYSVTGLNDSTINEIRVEAEAINVLNDTSTVSKIYLPDFYAPLVNTFTVSQNSIAIGDTTDVLGSFVDFVSGAIVGSGIDSVFVRAKKVGSSNINSLFSGTNTQFVNSVTNFTTQNAGDYQVFLRVTDNVRNAKRDTTEFVVNAEAHTVEFSDSDFGNFFNPNPANVFSFDVIQPQNVLLKPQTQQGIEVRVLETLTGNLLEGPFTPTYSVNDTVSINYSLGTVLDTSITEITLEVLAVNVLNDSALTTQNYVPDYFAPEILSFSISADTIGIGENITLSASFNDLSSGVSISDFSVVRPFPLSNLTFSSTNQNSFQVVFDSTNVAGTYTVNFSATDNVGNIVTQQTQFFVKSSPPEITFGGAEFNNFFNPNPPNLLNFTVIQKDEIPVLATNGISISIFGKPSGNLIFGPFQPTYSVTDTIQISTNVTLNIPQNDEAIDVKVTATNQIGLSETTTETFLIDGIKPSVTILLPQENEEFVKNSNFNFVANYTDEVPLGATLSKKEILRKNKKLKSKISELLGAGVDLSSISLVITSPDGLKTDVTSLANITATGIDFISTQLLLVGNYLIELKVADNVGNLNTIVRQVKVLEEKPVLNFQTTQFGDFFNPASPNTFSVKLIENGSTQFTPSNIKINVSRVVESGIIPGSTNIPFDFNRNGNEVDVSFLPSLTFATSDIGMKVDFILNHPLFTPDTLSKIYSIDNIAPAVSANSPEPNEEFIQDSQVNIFFSFDDSQTVAFSSKANRNRQFAKSKNLKITSQKSKNNISGNGSGIDTSSVVFRLEFPDGHQEVRNGLLTPNSFSLTTEPLNLPGNYAAILVLADNVGNTKLLNQKFKINKRVLPTTVPQIQFDAPFTFGGNPHNFSFLTYDDEGISSVSLKVSRLRATFENPEGVLEVIEESAEFDQTTQNDTVFVNYLAQFSLSNTSSAKDLEVVLEASITDFEGNLKVVTQSYKIDQDSPIVTQITPTNNTLIESLTNFSVRVDFEDLGIGIESAELEVVDSEGTQVQKIQGTIEQSASVGFAEIFITQNLNADNYQIIFTASDSLGNSIRQVSTFRVNSSLFVVEDIHNYPNPFRIGATTTFVFTATKDALVTIQIYDFAGRKVRTLLNEKEFRPQGNEIEIVPVWDGKDDSGSNLSKGVYFANVLVKEKNGEGKSKKVIKIALIK